MFSKKELDQIRITSPCTVDWDAMIGNDRVRFCQHCSLSVHDLSNVTRKKALRLIARSGGRLCIRYVALPNGSIATRTPSHLYRITRPASRLAAGAFGVTLTVSTAAVASQATGPSLSDIERVATIAQPLSVDCLAAAGAILSGYIYDPNGAVLPGASVALANLQTNLSMRTTTNGDGKYLFEDLEPGEYSIRIEANGFAPSEVNGIPLRADSENVINQTLSIATVQAEVEIVGSETVTQDMVMGVVSLPQPTDPLVLAAQRDDLEAVKQQLVGKPNVNARDQHSDSTALEHAVLNSNREMIQLLLWAGADVNARDKSGRTALMLLGDNITSDTVWDLINAGAKVNLRDNDGDTALIEAAACNNLEVVRALLDAGAKVNAKNNEGETALMQAANEGLVNNVRALILAGADINARDHEGKTAWLRALQNQQTAVLRLLRSYGVDEREPNNCKP
jgi:hypothetical protein